MPTEHDYLRARFDFVRQDLDAVLDRLNDSDLSWSPREGMPSIADLLLEIANKEKETLVWIQVGTWPDDGSNAFEIEGATVVGTRAVLSSLRTETYAYIDSLSDAQLNKLIASPEKWWEALRLTECPLGEVLRNIAMHEWYHTAQLTSYLWIRGDNPSEW